MKIGRRIPVLIAAVLLFAGAFYLGLLVRLPAERTFAYWLIDGQTLGVVVLDLPDLQCEIARVDESQTGVAIHAQCHERLIPVPQPAMAQQYVFKVTLHEPLGTRPVADGSGHLAESCQVPAPDCFPTG